VPRPALSTAGPPGEPTALFDPAGQSGLHCQKRGGLARKQPLDQGEPEPALLASNVLPDYRVESVSVLADSAFNTNH